MLRCMIVVLVMGVASFGQTISLTGTVVDQKGKPVEGAQVAVVGKKLIDVTDMNGKFSISEGTVDAGPLFVLPAQRKISFRNGMVHLDLAEPSDITIELFDMNGSRVEHITRRNAGAGAYQFDIVGGRHAAGMLLIRAAIGNHHSTYRYVPMSAGKSAFSRLNSGTSGAADRLAKVMAGVDSLKITASGFVTKVQTLASYQADLQITLDTLAYFSFFVTSLEAIKELSGSDVGFGGDLSFGFTGKGAGLKGADSICSCIAEKSMPGSSAKKWRAFLSVTEDENGKQVDARDRIGEGPWYDRVGRLLAPNLNDLLQERPANGNTQIKNDLPNEDGIPNHTPDPNKGEIDNHHMLTGSDTQGRLMKGSNCLDWTSSEMSSANKPQFGLSFPRGGFTRKTVQFGGMSSTHWFSAGSAGGCGAGIDLDASTMGGKAGDYSVGKGGGYGGFYCFALEP